jgi:hypothetical protein
MICAATGISEYQVVWWQQDGAHAHFADPVQEVLGSGDGALHQSQRSGLQEDLTTHKATMYYGSCRSNSDTEQWKN